MDFTILIDKLTRSIEDAHTGARVETRVTRLWQGDVAQIKKGHWLFDWKRELVEESREVYQLVTVEEPKVVQGLLSLEDIGNPVHLHLVESHPQNRSHEKKYLGVAGNLFAFACKRSVELGYGGYISFDSKTALIDHYRRSLGAEVLFGNRLVLTEDVANALINQYFST